MYEDFYATEQWSGKRVHCTYEALVVAIATRHADAVDVEFFVDGRPVWVALPHPAWAEYKRRNRKVITDPMAVQIAGRYLKQAIESGMESGREMYTLSVEETLRHLDAVLREAGVEAEASPASSRR